MAQPEKRTVPRLRSCGRVALLWFFVLVLGGENYGQELRPGKGEPAGSLESLGEVYVNDDPASTNYTIFQGDIVRTGATGTAVFTKRGAGTLKIAPESEVRISDTYEYTAELETGTAVMHSIAGPHEMTLRMQNYVLIPSILEASTTSKIERGADGSFLVSCLDGSIGVLTLVGGSGHLLQAGQSVRILSRPEPVGRRTPTKSSFGVEFPNKKGWALLGVAGAGAGGLALGLAHGGTQSPSPSAP